jgi:hypothetical protein
MEYFLFFFFCSGQSVGSVRFGEKLRNAMTKVAAVREAALWAAAVTAEVAAAMMTVMMVAVIRQWWWRWWWWW